MKRGMLTVTVPARPGQAQVQLLSRVPKAGKGCTGMPPDHSTSRKKGPFLKLVGLILSTGTHQSTCPFFPLLALLTRLASPSSANISYLLYLPASTCRC